MPPMTSYVSEATRDWQTAVSALCKYQKAASARKNELSCKLQQTILQTCRDVTIVHMSYRQDKTITSFQPVQRVGAPHKMCLPATARHFTC